jgi:hypothetical protein
MPHALFLGSNLATQDRVSQPPQPFPLPVDSRRPSFLQRLRRVWTGILYISRSQHDDLKDYTTRHGFRKNNSVEFIRAHIGHGTADVVLSLLGLAVPINSAYVPPPLLLSSLKEKVQDINFGRYYVLRVWQRVLNRSIQHVSLDATKPW